MLSFSLEPDWYKNESCPKEDYSETMQLTAVTVNEFEFMEQAGVWT